MRSPKLETLKGEALLLGFPVVREDCRERLAFRRPRTRPGNTECDPASDQQHANDWRHTFAVTGSHADVYVPCLNSMGLAVGNRHDQGCDAEHNQ